MRRKADDLRAECKLSDFKTKGVRGKHLKRYRAATNLVLLAPDVARVYPTDKAVNDALSGLMRSGIKQPQAAHKARLSRQQRYRNYVRKKHRR